MISSATRHCSRLAMNDERSVKIEELTVECDAPFQDNRKEADIDKPLEHAKRKFTKLPGRAVYIPRYSE
jgi:hypothetical protein